MSRFVIRPGETDFDVQDRIQGELDLPMTSRGVEQVAEMIETLRGRQLDMIYTSPSEPAYSAAMQVGERLEIPVKVLDRLANVNLGLWQGMTRSEIRNKQPRLFRQWEEAPETVCAPQGESCDEACERVGRALRKLIRKHGDFAVMASEPLATLVVSILKEERPKMCGPEKMACRHSTAECLEPAGLIS